MDLKFLYLLFAPTFAVTPTSARGKRYGLPSLWSFSLSFSILSLSLSLSLYCNLYSSLILLSTGFMSQLLVLVLTME
jgi:hypothetical protein